MSVLDLRAGRLDLHGNAGASKVIVSTWTDSDGDPYDLTGSAVSLWLGGTVTDPTDLTDATEVTGVIATATATFTFTIPDTRQPVRLTLDGALLTIGQVHLSTRGADSSTDEVTVQTGPAQLAVTLDGAAAIGSLAARLSTLEAMDTLGVELPLTLVDLGGTSEMRARGVARLIHSFAPGAAVASTATEASLVAATFDTAANELAEGDVLEFDAWGTLLNDDAEGDPHTTTYRLRGDGNVVAAANANLIADAATTRSWRFEGTILIGAGGAVNSTGRLTIRGALAGAADAGGQTVQDSTTTLDLTQPITWDLTADHDESSATLTTTLLGCILRHTKV